MTGTSFPSFFSLPPDIVIIRIYRGYIVEQDNKESASTRMATIGIGMIETTSKNPVNRLMLNNTKAYRLYDPESCVHVGHVKYSR
jgi:hypothetical protein